MYNALRNTLLRYGCVCAMCAVVLGVAASPAQEDARQYKLEADFLYNFFHYIVWPARDLQHVPRPSTICVFGSDPVIPFLEYVREKQAAKQRISIRQLSEMDDPAGCNIFFLRDHLPQEEMHIRGFPDILTVWEHPGSMEEGSMIELVQEDKHIGMKINQALLEKNHFQVSSRLLNLAVEVRKE